MHRLAVASLTAAGLSIGLAAAASAADLSRPAPAPVYTKAPMIAPPTWTGFYVGGNAGWVGSVGNDVTLKGTDTGNGGFGSELADGSTPSSFHVPLNGFIGGAQIGYNWQVSNWLWGIEADFDGVSASKSVSQINLPQPPFPPRLPITTTVSNKLDDLGTVRARLGWVVSNPFLIYATGGLAFGQTELGVSSVCPTCGPPRNLSTVNKPWEVGWTVGGGAEWMFARNWSAKAEYLYYDLGTNTTTPLVYNYGPSTSTLTGSIKETGQVVRGGINYHF
jgi:outer membrane immunogenic protein